MRQEETLYHVIRLEGMFIELHIQLYQTTLSVLGYIELLYNPLDLSQSNGNSYAALVFGKHLRCLTS